MSVNRSDFEQIFQYLKNNGEPETVVLSEFVIDNIPEQPGFYDRSTATPFGEGQILLERDILSKAGLRSERFFLSPKEIKKFVEMVSTE